MKVTYLARPERIARVKQVENVWFTANFPGGELGLFFKKGAGDIYRVEDGYDVPTLCSTNLNTEIHNYTPVDVEIIVREKK